jgi:hypothetical protein
MFRKREACLQDHLRFACSVIALIIGGLGVYNMRKVQRESTRLASSEQSPRWTWRAGWSAGPGCHV